MSTRRRVIVKLVEGLIALGFVLLAFLGVGLMANGVIHVRAAGVNVGLAINAASPGATDTTTAVAPGQSPTATKTRKATPTPKSTNTPVVGGSPTATTTAIATVTATVTVTVTPTIAPTRTPKPTPTPNPTQGVVIPILNTPPAGPTTTPTVGPSPDTGTPTVGITPTADTTNTTPTTPREKDDPMGMIVPIGAGAVGFMALAAVGFVIWQRRKRQEEDTPPLPAWQMGGAAMMQTPPVMQSGWADQRQWEMQFGNQNQMPQAPPETPPARIPPPPQDDYATSFYEEPQLDSRAMRAKFAQFSSSPDASFYQKQGNDDVTYRTPGPDMNNVMAASANHTLSMPPDGQGYPMNGTMLGPIDGLEQYNPVPAQPPQVQAQAQAQVPQYANGNGNGNGHQVHTPAPQPQQQPPLPPSPLNDPFLEAIMRQAQMGIFASPGKEG